MPGKRSHNTRTLEIEDEKVHAWSMGEVVEWTKVQEELMSSMKQEVNTHTEGESFNEKELRQALKKLRSWTGNLFGRQKCQVNGLLKDLIKSCKAIGPQNKWKQISSGLPWLEELPEKTCTESAKDIFIYGDELVKMLAVPPQEVKNIYDGRINMEELKMIQSLLFLKTWLVPMAAPKSSALLWAGFREEDTSKRTTKKKLFDFAKEIDHETVHTDAELGQLIAKHEDLNKCYDDPKLNKLTNNMWSCASMAFVLGMQEKRQGTIVALLNKDINGERPLKDSVFFRHEVPTVGVTAWGMDTLWSPQFLLIDMKGTCHKTSQYLRSQLFTHLFSFKPTKESQHTWRDVPKRSELAWTCLDCPPGQCDLDKNLASHVSEIVKAHNNVLTISFV